MNPADIKLFLIETMGDGHSHQAMVLILLTVIAAGAVLSYFLTKGALYALEYLIERSPTKWDDDLLNHRFMRGMSQLAPALVVNWLLPAFFTKSDGDTIHWIKTLTSLYILWAVVLIVSRLIGNLYQAFQHRKKMRSYAIKGIFQMLRLIVIGIGIIVGISILIGKEPMVILTALGASAAVLMLVFKDTILGLVASVQLTANKMLHRGDWIVCESHHANGEVEDVSLTTVKIRNWDNSITTIPPYALVSGSFRNYQPMRCLGGRRVERSIFIDINSVRFLEEDEIRLLDEKGLLDGIPADRTGNAVNLTFLRLYLENYLATHPEINKNMLQMVRQMEPTQSGLPLQLYFFTKNTVWKDFERIQSDIFDHIYAVIGHFGLRIFQTPTGLDIYGSGRDHMACNRQTIQQI